MSQLEHPVSEVGQKLDALRKNLNHVIRGKSEIIEHALTAMVAGGSILIEDVPGVGKTTLAKAIAASMDLSFQRVQCTPDLLPADIVGCSIFQPNEGKFHFRPGPVFCNLLLVDEINRASPRTQSALLEVMAEGQVTTEGERRELEPPFLVLATQNPIGFQGTFALPESQVDRFLFQLSMDYPDAAHEVDILFDQIDTHPLKDLQPVLTKDELMRCQDEVRAVQVSRPVADYLVEIARRTREDHRLKLGCSTRGSLMFFRASQAAAYVAQRNFVLPDDVQKVAPLVLSHRIVPHAGTRKSVVRDDVSLQQQVVFDILQQTPVPV